MPNIIAEFVRLILESEDPEYAVLKASEIVSDLRRQASEGQAFALPLEACQANQSS